MYSDTSQLRSVLRPVGLAMGDLDRSGVGAQSSDVSHLRRTTSRCSDGFPPAFSSRLRKPAKIPDIHLERVDRVN